MLHNGLLDLMNRSTCFGHYYAHHQELATIQMVSEYGSSPWLWQVAGLVHGCRFLERPGRGMFHVSRVERFIRFNKLLCSIELVLFSPWHYNLVCTKLKIL